MLKVTYAQSELYVLYAERHIYALYAEPRCYAECHMLSVVLPQKLQ
jgi:hypothetical protein